MTADFRRTIPAIPGGEAVIERYGGKLMTAVILAVYGGISLLGHGLHWLSPEDGHHHGAHVVACAAHGHGHIHHGDGRASGDHHQADCCHHHHHVSRPGDREGEGGGLAVRSNDCGTHSHVCEICNFLSQARGERAQLATAAVWQPLVVAAAPHAEPSYRLTVLSQHAPRGPPLAG